MPVGACIAHSSSLHCPRADEDVLEQVGPIGDQAVDAQVEQGRSISAGASTVQT